MPNFIEFCSGAGGLSTGLCKAGFTPVLLNDFDKLCCEVLKINHPDVNVVHEDMTKLQLDDYKGIDLIAAGIPCQAFSMAGLRKGLEDPRGKLLITYTEIINKLMPKVFLLENVKGLVHHKKGETLKSIIDLFNKSGRYTIYNKVLNANNHGVAQKRERLIIIGVLDNFMPFDYPKEIKKKVVLKDVLQNVPLSDGYLYNEHKKKFLDLIPQGGCINDLEEDKRTEYLNGKELHRGKCGILHRLSMNDHAPTLLCTPDGNYTCRCHPTETRQLRIREYARIQSFSDDYVFVGSKNRQYKQIGNAVPPQLGFEIGKCLLKLFKPKKKLFNTKNAV